MWRRGLRSTASAAFVPFVNPAGVGGFYLFGRPVDAGLAIQSHGIANQIEGAIQVGPAWTLSNPSRVDRSAVPYEKSLIDYPIPALQRGARVPPRVLR